MSIALIAKLAGLLIGLGFVIGLCLVIVYNVVISFNKTEDQSDD